MSTIAVPTSLVAYNWPPGSDRYRRVARFTDYLFTRVDKLQVAGFDPKWKTINLRRTVPGLPAFRRRNNGWIARHASRPTGNEGVPASARLAFALASAGPRRKAR